MANNYIAFIGRSTIDHTYYLNDFPHENSKCFAHNYIKQYGGPALNAAITCSLLGGNADIISCFGSQDLGLQAKCELQKWYEIGVYDTMNSDLYQIPCSSIMVNIQTATRTIVNSHKTATHNLTYDPISLLSYKIILLDGYNFTPALKAKLLEAKQNGAIIVLDGGSWKDDSYALIDLVDYAICSSTFIMPGGTKTATTKYLHQKGVTFVAFTNDEKDIEISESGVSKIIPIDTIQAIDTLGAGDVLHGAFCYYLAQENVAVEALKLASKIATRSCQFLGTHTWNSIKA